MRLCTINVAAAVLLAAAATGASLPAFAQASAPMQGAHDHRGMTMPRGGPAQPGGAAVPSGQVMSANHREMMAAMEKMNQEMMAPSAMTGDADRDFVAMMTPHHQGAIDMARIYLRDGKDPAIRRMAQKIIADQEREIREFRAWQAKHPAPAR